MRSPQLFDSFSGQSEIDEDFASILSHNQFFSLNCDSSLDIFFSSPPIPPCIHLTKTFFWRKMEVQQLFLTSIPYAIKYIFCFLEDEQSEKNTADKMRELLDSISPHVNVYILFNSPEKVKVTDNIFTLLRPATCLQDENQIDSQIRKEKEMFVNALHGTKVVLTNVSIFTNTPFQYVSINNASWKMRSLS